MTGDLVEGRDRVTGMPFEGPFGYENWRAFEARQPTTAGGEASLYSDARFTAELTSALGPYQVVNPVAMAPAGTLAPVLALRMDDHLPEDFFNSVTKKLFARGKSVLDHYHGGDLYDELTALLSLAHGVRLQAGPVTRAFDDRDPRGRPVATEEPAPSLLPRRYTPVIPSLVREAVPLRSDLLATYPNLLPADALALARAARSYQEGVWISDGDPQFAWLMLVSAVETAAARWWRATRASEGTDLEVLRESNEELAALLLHAGGEALASAVAAHVAQGMRAGYKFRAFLLTFCPSPPEPRPAVEGGRLDWSPGGLQRTLKKLYEHRSKALHESIPFPLPMCTPPGVSGTAKERTPSWSGR